MTPFDCPRCGSTLTMSERHGIEIDYCPQCRGVWLDRGELDKIIDRVAAQPSMPDAPKGGWTQPQAPAAGVPHAAPGGWAPPPAPGWTAPQHQGYRRDDDDDDYRYRGGGHGKPRKHWLSELFD